MKQFFKVTNLKRIITLGATLMVAVLIMVFGSVFYLGKPGVVKKSSEYDGATEFLINIDAKGGKTGAELAPEVADSIKDRLDPLGLKSVVAAPEIYGDNGLVHVTYPRISSIDERNAVQAQIINKPQLVLTDIYGNPLFNKNGSFRADLRNDPGKFVPYSPGGGAKYVSSSKELYYRSENTIFEGLPTTVPIQSNGAQAKSNNNTGKKFVEINLKDGDAQKAWAEATTYLSSLPAGKQLVLGWLNPQVAYTKVYNYFVNSHPDVMSAQNDINKFVRINQTQHGPLRSNTVQIADYLISQARVEKVLAGKSFIIEGSFTAAAAQKLARNINYGVSNYSLTPNLTLDQKGATYGNNAFKLATIAGIVVFFAIALILIVNYGLLGALSTISLALFIFLTLFFFTVMRGEYSPVSIAALVIGIGMSVDVVIVTFERLKSEIYAGSSLKRAYKISQRKSFTTIFDSNLTTMIVAVVLFYFGTRSIVGLSVTLILSIVFTMVVMLIITRFTSNLLVRSEYIKNNKWLLGAKPKFDVNVQNQINKIDYMKNTKWFSLFSFVIMIVGFIVFITYATINGSFAGGFNLSQDFTGGISIQAKGDVSQISDLYTKLVAFGIDPSAISQTGNELSLRTTQFLTDADIKSLYAIFQNGGNIAVFNTTSFIAKRLTIDAIYAILIAMGFIVIYTSIRFKWTYSIASLIALAHDAIIVLLFFTIFRIEISPIFVAAILTTVGYSINDTIVTFDRVREKMNAHVGPKDKASITRVANEAIKDTLKRSFLTSASTLLAIIILMSFGQATKLQYNIAMLVGLVSGTYSSIFIATWAWVRFETYRQKRIISRDKKGFWNTKGLEEQTVPGINDFVA